MLWNAKLKDFITLFNFNGTQPVFNHPFVCKWKSITEIWIMVQSQEPRRDLLLLWCCVFHWLTKWLINRLLWWVLLTSASLCCICFGHSSSTWSEVQSAGTLCLCFLLAIKNLTCCPRDPRRIRNRKLENSFFLNTYSFCLLGKRNNGKTWNCSS